MTADNPVSQSYPSIIIKYQETETPRISTIQDFRNAILIFRAYAL